MTAAAAGARIVLLTLLAPAGAWGQSPDGTTFAPRIIGTAPVPLSESDKVSLLSDGRTACVIESYETRVHCVNADGAVMGVFGREGEGPGEFGSPAYLARGEDGTVGVADLDLGRFSVFQPSGALMSDLRLPSPSFSPSRSFAGVLSGVSLNFDVMLAGGNSGTLMTRFDLDIAAEEVVRREASPRGPWDVECGSVVYGIPDGAGGWAFVACEGHLIFVGETGDATVLRAPTYDGQLPDERDVARREEELMAFSRGLGQLGLSPTRNIERRLDRYRATPKRYFLGTAHQLFDAADRYWIATQRDLHEWSYLDVYANAEYVGSVQVRDQLLAFDLLGSTLVVLVERQVGPDAVIPDRALDWYDIGELPWPRGGD